MKLGEKIYQLRKQNGMSQEELASQITVSRQAVSKWELGESVPDTDNIVQICKLFGISADFLLNDDIESDLDIAVVRENIDKLKGKYNRVLLWILSIGVVFIIYYVLRDYIRLEIPNSLLIASVVVVCAGAGYLVSFFINAHQKNKNK
jgi:transcriptional regulator with XRE-family HTH domain